MKEKECPCFRCTKKCPYENMFSSARCKKFIRYVEGLLKERDAKP
jgi:hypothetical protein